MRIFGIVGWKNSGKTGLMERLVTDIAGRGLTVSTIKHAHHAFDVDQPGKDSYRHRAAGATEVLVSSAQRYVVMHEVRGTPEPPLSDLLARLSPVDLVLIEGYKTEGHRKIEAHRAVTGQPLLAPRDDSVLAIASDSPHPGLGRPVFDLDDTTGIAGFILHEVGLMPLAGTGS